MTDVVHDLCCWPLQWFWSFLKVAGDIVTGPGLQKVAQGANGDDYDVGGRLLECQVQLRNHEILRPIANPCLPAQVISDSLARTKKERRRTHGLVGIYIRCRRLEAGYCCTLTGGCVLRRNPGFSAHS